MPQRIKLRNSVVEGQKPDPADLAIGEVCVGAHPNTPGLIFKDSDDNIIELSPSGGELWEVSDIDGEKYLTPSSPNENALVPGELRLQGTNPRTYFKQIDADENDEGRAEISFQGDGSRTDWKFVYETKQGGLDVDKGSVVIYPSGRVDVGLSTNESAFSAADSVSQSWNTQAGGTAFEATNYDVSTFTADTMGNVYVRRDLTVGSETTDGGKWIEGTVNVYGTLKATKFDLESLDPLPA